MPEPVSVVGLCVGYAALHVIARSTSAISPEAQQVRQAANALVASAEHSHVLFGDKVAAISNLRRLASECSEEGWDGSGSAGISPCAVQTTETFLRVLPDGYPLPECASEPDGSISLDWIQSRTRFFSLSIGASNRFAYAWIDGTDKGHGVASFDGTRIPQRILEGINAITSNANAAVRSC
jgi:hypothetical protein